VLAVLHHPAWNQDAIRLACKAAKDFEADARAKHVRKEAAAKRLARQRQPAVKANGYAPPTDEPIPF
jgi:hypothetical protein